MNTIKNPIFIKKKTPLRIFSKKTTFNLTLPFFSSMQITSCLLTLPLSHLSQKSWMISVRWNVTYIWSHSSVTRVWLHGKNRAKTNRAQRSPANREDTAKVYCSCSIFLSFFHSACLFLSISFPICASLVCTLLCHNFSLSLLPSLSTALWAPSGETELQSAQGSQP